MSLRVFQPTTIDSASIGSIVPVQETVHFEDIYNHKIVMQLTEYAVISMMSKN
ncbi:hypothetical protein JCM18750_40540 [Halostagnicola bangensis]